jgi:mannose/fructose/N-acetylgalactosamine-specific phosphotransferase system component IID
VGAILGLVAIAIAAILKLTGHSNSVVLWVIIVAVALIGAEVAWGWHRGGYYRRSASGV